MKKTIIVAAVAFGLVASTAFAATNADINLNNKQAKLSYALGVNLGNNFKKMGMPIKANIVAQGIRDALAGQAKLDSKQINAVVVNFQKEMIAKRMKKFKAKADTNGQAGQMFLAANKDKAGIKTLADGLQYKIIKAGTGSSPTVNDTVKVNYEGMTVDGKVFDSSYKRGKPVSFKVNQVIPAWTQALQKMRVGATWMVYAPAKLAYGKTGIGPIGPNQTLIFKIELLSITKGKPAKS